MPPTRLSGAACVAVAVALAFSFAATTPAGAVTANGRLQIIHLDVGQGDGAVIITPLGQVVMIDEGERGAGREAADQVLVGVHCDPPPLWGVAFLRFLHPIRREESRIPGGAERDPRIAFRTDAAIRRARRT